MSTQLSGLWSLVGTGLRGLRSRFLLTLGSVLLAAISVSAAVLGPMYQAGAASSYLVTRLQTEPNFLTGLVFDYQPGRGQTYRSALAAGRQQAARALDDRFSAPTVALWAQRSKGLGGLARVVWTPSSCAHVILVGRCPSRPDEALILAHDSSYAHVKVGQQVRIEDLAKPLTIVGTYIPRDSDGAYWFNLADLASVPPQQTGNGMTPYLPAPLLVDAQTFSAVQPGSWYVRDSRRLIVTAKTSASDLQAATREVARLNTANRGAGIGLPAPGHSKPEVGNELVPVSHEVQLRRETARSTVAPAVVSVVLVALVLLLRLLSAAMDLRRAELALASLRGFSRRQMWLLGLIEPVLMVVIATPIGIVAGYLAARALGRIWLVPGLPLPFGTASLLAMLAVVVSTLVISALVVREALSEPLSSQIAGVRRPGRSGRWAVLLRLVLVASAVAVLVATLASGSQSSPSATDLALPILLAVAAGLLTTLAAQVAAGWWATATGKRRGVFGYLASRTISRRREGTLVILPLTAALAVAIFAAGVFTAAADWRASDAATVVGADRSYSTQLTMDQAVALTHQIDPGGKWLMAAAAEYHGSDERLIIDAPRLARVGVWPSSWTPGLSAADVSRDLSVKRPSVVLEGSTVSLTLDNHVAGVLDSLTIELSYTRSNGELGSAVVGPFRQGASSASAHLAGCSTGCLLQQLSFGGAAAVPAAMHGTATVTGFRVDGAPVRVALDDAWRVAVPLLHTPSGVSGRPRVSGGRLTVTLDSRSAQFFAAITPDDVPLVRPVIIGRTAQPVVTKVLPDALVLQTDAFLPLTVRRVATSESMPVLGPKGLLIDYTMLTRDVAITNGITFVSILARSDTPAPVVAALAAHGITQAQTLASERRLLDQDAFALALNLYLVVTVIVILLAVAGLAANLAVQMPARRRDAASLRVVGLRRRSIVAAVVTEFFVVLGAAALAGIAAGSAAQYVVVRTVTLGYADTQHTPRLLASLNLRSVTDLLVVVTAVLFLVAVTVAALTVRGARTATLRENAR